MCVSFISLKIKWIEVGRFVFWVLCVHFFPVTLHIKALWSSLGSSTPSHNTHLCLLVLSPSWRWVNSNSDVKWLPRATLLTLVPKARSFCNTNSLSPGPQNCANSPINNRRVVDIILHVVTQNSYHQTTWCHQRMSALYVGSAVCGMWPSDRPVLARGTHPCPRQVLTLTRTWFPGMRCWK